MDLGPALRSWTIQAALVYVVVAGALEAPVVHERQREEPRLQAPPGLFVDVSWHSLISAAPR